MENFTTYNPTSLHFGRNILPGLPDVIHPFGTRVLLVYGQGSVKRSGLYDRIMQLLTSAGMEVFEYGGIRSNPVIEDVEAAASLGRKHHVEVVLAVGGGSVIDSAKTIAVTIPVTHPAWDFFIGKATPRKALPLVTVLTLAATGSEMNAIAVVSNHEARLKAPIRSPLIFPRHSFLDPEVTMTVPLDYTAYGIADLIAHCMEAWFGAGACPMSDKLVLSIIREAMEAGPALLKELKNYTLRARIMYAATLALNGITMQGKVSGEFGVHAAGHILSLLYGVPHGASLTIVYPAWMRLFREQAGPRIAELVSGMFGESLSVDQSIGRFEDFFLSLGCPVKLRELAIPDVSVTEIVKAMEHANVNGMNMKFKPGDYLKLVELYM